MTALPAVGWGDAVRVAAALDPDPRTLRRILTMLGLVETAAEGPRDAALGGPQSLPPPPDDRRPERPHITEVLTAGRARPLPQTAAEYDSFPAPEIERLAAGPVRPPRPLPPLHLPPSPSVDLAPADLLAPERQWAILCRLCSGPASTSEVDVAALVPLLARREPVQSMPMHVRHTTRRGTQLLVDHGPAMTPFARDEDDVRRAITRIVGVDGLEVLRFSVTPLDPPGAGTGPLWTWRPYRAQPYGQPVVALTDLGALAPFAHRSDIEARWIRFALLLREAGCPFIALSPMPAARLPHAIRAAIAVVTWDRSTSIRDAVLAARRAGGRMPRIPT